MQCALFQKVTAGCHDLVSDAAESAILWNRTEEGKFDLEDPEEDDDELAFVTSKYAKD